jgi:translation initiation factor 2B subunit (eIF-2B alpha/beta/delta family)
VRYLLVHSLPFQANPFTSHRQLIGSREVALEVIRLLREVVAQARFNSFDQLTAHLEEVGRLLQEAGPKGESIFFRFLLRGELC